MSCLRLIVVLATLLPAALFGHHDVNAVILGLDKKIKAGPTADLHYQRALEYRALRNPSMAEEDLRAALKLDSKHRGARTALILLLETPEAMTLAKSYLESSTDPKHRLEALYLIAQVADRSGDPKTALSTCRQIQKDFPDHPSEVDLLHARLLLTSGKPGEAAEVLKTAHQKHKSVVLRNAWIDAALSAGETAETLPIIEKEIASSRFRASWLIRRARAHLILNQPDKSRPDLNSALLELNSRIQPDRPDLTLIADRGLALTLLGSRNLARRDLEKLKKSTLSPSAYVILEAELLPKDQ